MFDLNKYSDNPKRNHGQYFTRANPFDHEAFKQWAQEAGLTHTTLLEPFAGSNNLINMLQGLGLCRKFKSFDIEPKNPRVIHQDTLRNFPKGFHACVTNPPYLAKNSAKRRRLFYPDTLYDDLYKFALDQCLKYCSYVAAIIPASFLNACLFRHRLSCYILLNHKMFIDTDHPVCLALFKPALHPQNRPIKLYENAAYLGLLNDIEKKLPQKKSKISLKFNDKMGALGLIAVDNTLEPSIQFCNGNLIPPDKIQHSSRSITRISLNANVSSKKIKTLNRILMKLREETFDLFLTPFKGLRKDNKYRRRLDYALASMIIHQVF